MKIDSKLKTYAAETMDGLLEQKEAAFRGVAFRRPFYFIDANVYRLYEERMRRFVGDDRFLIIDALETNKEYSALTAYYRFLIDHGFTRKDALVTFGGGILQDMSGFIASTLYRGTPWIFFPTTLLAQADSCIGSKTSINFGDAKNLIGTFYPPDSIRIDIAFTETLSSAEFTSGLGEIIKCHCMADEAAHRQLKEYLAQPNLRDRRVLEPMMWSALKIKQSFFAGDEFDTGRRNLLNYGHCFGHALESATQFAVPHGQAVIVGMGFANLLSLRRGILDTTIHDSFARLLQPHYPPAALSSVDAETIIRYMRRDKKRTGEHLSVILTSGIGGQKKYDDVTEQEIRDTFHDFSQQYSH